MAGEYGVAAVLTGHMHDFLVDSHPVKREDAEGRLYELRCGTTLQGYVPKRPRNQLPGGGPTAWVHHQGYFVHQIVLNGDPPAVSWRIWQHQFNGLEFITSERPTYDFALDP